MPRKNKFTTFIKTRPAFLFLLPFFAVLHGFIGNYEEVPLANAILLTLAYILGSLIVAFIAWFFFRDIMKACVLGSLFFAWFFFYGAIQDDVQRFFPGSFLLRYRFIIPAVIVFFLVVSIWLYRRKKSLLTLASYLNVLTLLLIMFELVIFVPTAVIQKTEKILINPIEGMTVCDTCQKPDVFLIIPDQYPGNSALKAIFNFDNTDFEKELTARGFHVSAGSSSNYNLTPFSVASTLNMSYIPVKEGQQNPGSVSLSYNLIRNNSVLKFFLANKYRFFNCSIFNFPGQPANEYGAFLPYGTKLITAQTFAGRLVRDFKSDIIKGRFGKRLQNKFAYKGLHFNEHVLHLTHDVAAMKISEPKFVYTHVMMPHYPYFFDSKGRRVPIDKLTGVRKANKADFIEYLKYTNTKILQLVDEIFASSPRPPIIMILSDHGYRQIDDIVSTDYDFTNLNAIFLPNRKYEDYHNAVSNVNHFRVFFNSWFHQQLPLLSDSTINVLRTH